MPRQPALAYYLNPLLWWRWLRVLRHNPVYIREKGGWGKPNPFYANLSRFSPFVILGAIFIGICTGSTNPGLFIGNESLTLFYCVLCLPGILLTMLTLFGTFMAPALTAPSISYERTQGTWDILRLTPQSTPSILMAKLFGGLARLRISLLLLALTILQGGLLFLGGLFVLDPLSAGILGVATSLRPWLEIFLAAVMGMFVSTWTRSSTLALVAAYGGLITFKLFNNTFIWLGISAALFTDERLILMSTNLGITGGYAVAVFVLMLGIIYRGDRMNYE